MMVRMQFVLPALLALAGCSTAPAPVARGPSPVLQAQAAEPQRVTAASNALGQKLDGMVAAQRASVTR